MTDNIAMLVISCDAYTSLAYDYFKYMDKFMGWFDGPVYFVNEEKPFYREGVNVLHMGKTLDWSGRVLGALRAIDSKYVLLMLEDYFIGSEVEKETFEQALRVIKSEDFVYYRITNSPEGKGSLPEYPYLSPIGSNVRYGINLQAAIIRRDFFIDMVSGEDRSAWQVEADRLKNVTETHEFDLPGCVVDTRNIIDIRNGVIKGKWYPDTLKHFRHLGMPVEIGDRAILSRWDTLVLKARVKASSMVSRETGRRLKKLMSKFGMNFVSQDR